MIGRKIAVALGCAVAALAVWATDRSSLEQTCELYASSDPGGFTELTKPGASVLSLAAPEFGKLFVDVGGRAAADEGLSPFFAYGSSVLEEVKDLKLDCRLTCGGFMKFLLSFGSENERAIALVRAPLSYIVPCVAWQIQSDTEDDPDSCARSFFGNLRLSGSGRAIRLETFFKPDEKKAQEAKGTK